MARELSEDKSRNITSSGGFCYSDVSSMMNQIQGFEGDPSEIFNLTTGMEMIGFSNDIQQHTNKPGNNPGPSSSTRSDHFYQHDQFTKQDFTTGMSETSGETENLIAAPGAYWQLENNNSRLLVDDSSLRCVFPCEGNERPSQGLSLSLSSSNPSSTGLQSFQLGQINHDQQDGFFGNPASVHQQQQQNGQLQLRNSKYLAPAQELLNEFCSLGTKQNDATKLKSNKSKQWDDENASNSSRNQPLYSLEFMELQKRKTKLLSMLEEVDRRYRHYCDQMKAMVSSFEVMTGNGAATVYSALASNAMSRHFRRLRDGIVCQIQATKKAMGEKDLIAPGTSKGETPRLKIIDQALRQQRAFQQMTTMESHPWRTQRGLPEKSVYVLRAWLFEHFFHPYPDDVDKHILARQTGLSGSQVSNWFINARVRLWKPMVEEMYLEETKEQDNSMALSSVQIQNPPAQDQKPTESQLVRIDSECLSSIINNHDKNEIANKTPKALHHQNHHLQQNFGSSFEAMELDFSSYDQHVLGGVSYANNDHQNFNGGDVSLTLGLQQHGGSGVSLAFSPASQSSLFYHRDHIEECQPIQYSLLDGD